MLRIFALFILLLLLVACSEPKSELPAGTLGRIFRVADLEEHRRILAKLNEMDIPYVIGQRGLVETMMADQARVEGIRRWARYGPELDSTVWEPAVMVDDEMRNDYEREFVKAGIRYSFSIHNGITSIEWNQLDGPKVDVVLQRVDQQRMDKLHESFQVHD